MTVEITDNMVERAAIAAADRTEPYMWKGLDEGSRAIKRRTARIVLEAALNPPQVEVTQGMLNAGSAAYLKFIVETGRGDLLVDLNGLTIAYRAMYAARPDATGLEARKENKRGG